MRCLARQVSSDVRNYHIHRILGMSPRTLMNYLYPRLLALHDLDDHIALPQLITNDDGTTAERILMPECMRNSYFQMESGGLYLIGKIPITACNSCKPDADAGQTTKRCQYSGLALAPHRNF
jgi:hypothetical protein